MVVCAEEQAGDCIGGSVMMSAPPHARKPVRLPLVSVMDEVPSRQDVARRRKALEKTRANLSECSGQMREQAVSEDALLRRLEAGFVPAHGPSQIISPRLFFNSPLFRVCSKAIQRSELAEFALPGGDCVYRGPELRQVDGLVFMALVNMARDTPAGIAVQFRPDEVCNAIYQRYDGPARQSLKESIQRLQQGLLKFKAFSVQLAMRFDYPSHGWWSVALDRSIVQLFWHSPQVWLSLDTRLALPDGLATWLYCYAQSHTRLIPTPVTRIRALCGSTAQIKGFSDSLRSSLKMLVEHGVLEKGAAVSGGIVRWTKAAKAPGDK